MFIEVKMVIAPHRDIIFDYDPKVRYSRKKDIINYTDLLHFYFLRKKGPLDT